MTRLSALHPTEQGEARSAPAEPSRHRRDWRERNKTTRERYKNRERFQIILSIAVLLILAVTPARAQDAEIHADYVTTKGACANAAAPRVTIAAGRITGPGFDCQLGEGRPAGSGLVAHEATCAMGGKLVKDGIALDLGNYRDHFELALPGRAEWVKLYPCSKVPGLE